MISNVKRKKRHLRFLLLATIIVSLSTVIQIIYTDAKNTPDNFCIHHTPPIEENIGGPLVKTPDIIQLFYENGNSTYISVLQFKLGIENRQRILTDNGNTIGWTKKPLSEPIIRVEIRITSIGNKQCADFTLDFTKPPAGKLVTNKIESNACAYVIKERNNDKPGFMRADGNITIKIRLLGGVGDFGDHDSIKDYLISPNDGQILEILIKGYIQSKPYPVSRTTIRYTCDFDDAQYSLNK